MHVLILLLMPLDIILEEKQEMCFTLLTFCIMLPKPAEVVAMIVESWGYMGSEVSVRVNVAKPDMAGILIKYEPHNAL